MDPTFQLITTIGAIFAAFGVVCGLLLKLNGQIKSSELRLWDEMQSLRTEMKGDMQSLRTEMKGDIKELRGEIKELGSKIHDVEVSVEGLNQNSEMIKDLLIPTMQETVRTALLQD